MTSKADSAIILVVEDDEATEKTLPNILEFYGYSVIHVNSIEKGLNYLKNTTKSPDFLLLDLVLPDGNGVEILDYIRENSLPIKCAVTTGWLSNIDDLDGIKVFTKPISLDELIEFLS
jgi:DNA-binding response OmpR family regulator